VNLGFTHILPRCLDHILFVRGLYLLDPLDGAARAGDHAQRRALDHARASHVRDRLAAPAIVGPS
jgi:hypothetical protein